MNKQNSKRRSPVTTKAAPENAIKEWNETIEENENDNSM